MSTTLYDFSAINIQGKVVKMDTFQGKYVLIVNTASKCGLTPQYTGLEELYQKYKNKGLVVLGFPCNQFANQEPGDVKQISEGCLVNYGVSFPMFTKIKVNGNEAHPIYKFLKSEQPGCFGSFIKWNFTKFLVDTNGKPIKRFAPFTKPSEIDNFLSKLLN